MVHGLSKLLTISAMETVTTVLLYLSVAILLTICVRYLRILVRIMLRVLKYLLVFSEVVQGESHRDFKKPVRLYPFVCKTQYLDEVTINELYNFMVGSEFQLNVKSKAEGIGILHKSFLSYSHILLLRDMIDGSLRGILMFGFVHKQGYTFLKLGYTFTKSFYRGGPSMYVVLGLYVLKELICHPLTPIIAIGTAFSYKSYLVAMRFKESYPRYDREPPAFVKEIFHEFAHGVKREEDEYDPERFVIKMEWANISKHHAAVTEQDLENPHIKFYVTNNPGYTKGHTQVLGVRLGWPDIMTTVIRTALKGSRRDNKGSLRKGSQAVKKLKIQRRYSFQEESFNAYAVSLFQADLAGEAIECSSAAVQDPLSPFTPLKSPEPEINFKF